VEPSSGGVERTAKLLFPPTKISSPSKVLPHGGKDGKAREPWCILCAAIRYKKKNLVCDLVGGGEKPFLGASYRKGRKDAFDRSAPPASRLIGGVCCGE